MHRKKSYLFHLIGLFLLLFYITGCSSATQEVIEPVTELTDEERFVQIIDKLFYESVTESGLTLHSTLCDPTSYGITEFPATFGSYGVEDMEKNYQELRSMQHKLSSIDKKQLSDALQTDYEILTEYLDAEAQGEDFCLYHYPFASMGGVQTDLPIILAEYQFRSVEDVDNYLALLADIDEYYAQLLQYVQVQTDAGIYLSDLTIDGIVDSCEVYLDSPLTGMLATTFSDRLDTLLDLTEEERTSYLSRNAQILAQDFTDAYTLLSEGLKKLKGHQELPVGLSELPHGKEYYEYLLKSSTFTSYPNPRALKDAITRQLQTETNLIYEQMEKHPDLYQELNAFQFSIQDPANALLDLQEKLKADFPEIPACSYEIRMLPEALEDYASPAFYLTPPIDSQDENFIYINRSASVTQEDIYTVMAHEGYPGHLYQCNYFNRINDSRLRALMSFSCYVEGWATYVQFLSYQWEDSVSSDTAKVLSANESVYLALSALVDYQVNYEGMGLEELQALLTQVFGINSPETARHFYQMVCEDPANYMKYYVGYLEIMEMKQEAMEELGESFEAKEFHRFLLDLGPAPFSIIRSRFAIWLEELSNQNAHLTAAPSKSSYTESLPPSTAVRSFSSVKSSSSAIM